MYRLIGNVDILLSIFNN